MEEDFAKVCNLSAKAVRSELYEKKLEFDAIFEAQVELIERLGNSLTLDKIKAAITGVDTSKEASFFSVWQDRINFFRTNNNGEQYTTAESYECAMKSFQKILWDRPITGFKVGKEDIEYWSNGMQNGVLNENGELIGQIRRRQEAFISETVVQFGMNVCHGAILPTKNIHFLMSRKRISWQYLSATQGRITT